MAPSPEVIRNAIPVLKNVDTDKLVETANRYLGVKYLFGADPYPQSGKFDCSTFTQYVFGKYGISLPRTARAQARDGSSVSRKMLRKGDLMFYYVPGRFKSNKTIGHVGIYMGNNKMIHASPAPDNGVQISNINHEYWKKTFLQAKRFVD
jgi:cell wall-associated NlpC family hydrolase